MISAVTEELTVTPKVPPQAPTEQEQAAFLTAKFPAKPAQRCDLGFPIALRANHYRIKLNRPLTIYQYDIDLKKIRDPNFEVTNKESYK